MECQRQDSAPEQIQIPDNSDKRRERYAAGRLYTPSDTRNGSRGNENAFPGGRSGADAGNPWKIKRRKKPLKGWVALMEEGRIDEAENRLYDLTSGEGDEDRHNLEAGLLFYYILNGKDDDFLEEHDFSREEIMTGIQDLANRYGLSGIAEAFRA